MKEIREGNAYSRDVEPGCLAHNTHTQDTAPHSQCSTPRGTPNLDGEP